MSIKPIRPIGYVALQSYYEWNLEDVLVHGLYKSVQDASDRVKLAAYGELLNCCTILPSFWPDDAQPKFDWLSSKDSFVLLPYQSSQSEEPSVCWGPFWSAEQIEITEDILCNIYGEGVGYIVRRLRPPDTVYNS